MPGATCAKADDAITQVFNASRTCNQFVFRHNAVRNGRRIGVLAKGRGGLIENNTFEGLVGGAVEFWNAPFEGLGAVDYVVRNNRIRDCGQLAREHAAIWTTIFQSGTDRLHHQGTKSVKYIVILPALLLAPLAAPPASRTLPLVPMCGKLRIGSFQLLETRGTRTSDERT